MDNAFAKSTKSENKLPQKRKIPFAGEPDVTSAKDFGIALRMFQVNELGIERIKYIVVNAHDCVCAVAP